MRGQVSPRVSHGLLTVVCMVSATTTTPPSCGPSSGVIPAASRPAGRARPAESQPAAPHTSERAADRERMVATQIAARGIQDERVLAAMRTVPRHWFVPESGQPYAYEDHPLPIGHGQTISQPYIVALMTELLEVKPGQRVLEIGTGSGYQAAILAEMGAEVYSIEIVRPLGERARRIFEERGFCQISVRIGDGYQGWPDASPFDAIIVTCAPESPPHPLVEQLATGGRMCVPVGPEGGVQELILLRKQADGSLHRESVAPVQFVPMTGQARGKGG